MWMISFLLGDSMVGNPVRVTGTEGWAAVDNRWVLRWWPVPKSSSHLEGSDTVWVLAEAGPPPLQAQGSPMLPSSCPLAARVGTESRPGALEAPPGVPDQQGTGAGSRGGHSW